MFTWNNCLLELVLIFACFSLCSLTICTVCFPITPITGAVRHAEASYVLWARSKWSTMTLKQQECQGHVEQITLYIIMCNTIWQWSQILEKMIVSLFLQPLQNEKWKMETSWPGYKKIHKEKCKSGYLHNKVPCF